MRCKCIHLHGKTLFLLLIPVTLLTSIFGEKNQTIAKLKGLETVSFFDGSSLLGSLHEIRNEGNLVWSHKSSRNPLVFDYQAVESILFNRLEKELVKPTGSMVIHLKNKDFIRGAMKSLSKEKLIFSSGFGQNLEANISDVQSLEFLPKSYQVLYDSSYDFEKWKKSNTKAWTEEQGSLISVFSGSTGTTLPEVDAIEVKFEASWQRSFYLALRFFSDSDGGSYGSEGYHLSFSNNRINLQSNRKLKGRTIRETLGSVMVDSLVGVKKADFKIYAHRQHKEFIVFVNETEVARWKDPTSDHFTENSGLLFINQGGNSYLKLEELTIAGWKGQYFLTIPPATAIQERGQFIAFKNGDYTSIQSSSSTKNGLLIKTKRGTYEVPYENIRSVHFPNNDLTKNEFTFNEEINLTKSLGKLSFELNSISNHLLHGQHPYLGRFQIPLERIKRLRGNLLLKSRREYLSQLRMAETELKSQNSEKALSILEKTNPAFRSWYWKRLSFLAQDSEAREILWFTPHPDVGILNATLCDGENGTIFTTSKNGSFALWDQYAKLTEGNYTTKDSTTQEAGRSKNEKWKKILISNNFWLGSTEFKQEQFEKITGTNPSKKKGPDLPVQVSWFESMEFCKLMNQKFPPPNGLTWRLPTEAEWEYAARAGSTGPYCNTFFGKLPNNQKAYEEHLKEYGWYSENSSGKINPVSQKLSNPWGLFDMHGNVWEWCLDGTSVNKTELFSFPRAGAKDPVKLDGDWKVLKGGSFLTDYARCRSGYRGANAPSVSNGDRGFRICLGPSLSVEESHASKIDKLKKISASQVQEFSPIPLTMINCGEFMMGSRGSFNFADVTCNLEKKTIWSCNSLSKFASRKLASKKPEWEIDLNGTGLVIVHLALQNHLLVGTEKGNVYLIDGKDKKIITTYKDHHAPISSIAVDRKEQSFASCALDGRIVFRKLSKKESSWTLTSDDYQSDVEYLEFSNDSRSLLASGLHSNVMIIDTKIGKPQTVWQSKEGIVLKAKWLPKKNYIIILHANGILSFLEGKSGVIYKIVPTNLSSAFDFQLSKDGERILLITDKGSCSLRELPDHTSIVVLNPDGKIEKTPDFYFCLAKPKKTNKSNLDDYLLKNQMESNGSRSKFIAYSPGKHLVATTHDGSLRIWSGQTGDFITTIAEKLSSYFIDCSFSRDGRILSGKLESGHQLFYPTTKKFIANSSEELKAIIEYNFFDSMR